MHLRVVLRHAERARVDAVAAIEAARLQRRHHDAVLRNLDRVRRTNERARRLLAVHADGRHRRSRLGAVDVVDKDHRVAFVRRALAARGDAGAAADATLRIDEHCLFHQLTPFCTSLRDAPLRCLPRIGNCPRMNLLDSRGAGFVLRNLRSRIERRIRQLIRRQLFAPVIRE